MLTKLMSERVKRFSFRKTSIGLASVVLGISLLMQVQTVRADDTNVSSENQSELVRNENEVITNQVESAENTNTVDLKDENNTSIDKPNENTGDTSTTLSEGLNTEKVGEQATAQTESNNSANSTTKKDESSVSKADPNGNIYWIDSYPETEIKNDGDTTNDANNLTAMSLVKRRFINVVDPITGKTKHGIQYVEYMREEHGTVGGRVDDEKRYLDGHQNDPKVTFHFKKGLGSNDYFTEWYQENIFRKQFPVENFPNFYDVPYSPENRKMLLTGTFSEFITPQIEGYVPSQEKVEAKSFDPYEYQDETITITYLPIKKHETGTPLTQEELPLYDLTPTPNESEKPQEPEVETPYSPSPGVPEVPTTPEVETPRTEEPKSLKEETQHLTVNRTQTKRVPNSTTAVSLTHIKDRSSKDKVLKVNNKENSSTVHRFQLPQTGEENGIFAVLAGLIAIATAFLGLTKRKNG